MMKDSDESLLTVSLGTWMELPNLSIKNWAHKNTITTSRISVATVAKYYKEYVKLMSLGANFEEETHVTSIRKISNGQPNEQNQSKTEDNQVVHAVFQQGANIH